MQRLLPGVVVVVLLVCCEIPGTVIAQDAASYNASGADWFAKGQYDKALADFSEAIRLDPSFASAYSNRGGTWNSLGEYAKAVADCTEAIRLNPNTANPYNNRGIAWNKMGEYDKAIADCNEVIKLAPNSGPAYNTRAAAWFGKGEDTKAIADASEAIRIAPAFVASYDTRGKAYVQTGQYDKAIPDYNKAIQLARMNALAYNDLAWLQATCPDQRYRDGQKAFQNANKAYQLDNGKSWHYIDTLAAAYAEAGDFDAAVQWETKAIALAGNAKGVEGARSRLELFKAKKPYRDELKKQ
jgi:tetratricopeptide (TPR) repeat protein